MVWEFSPFVGADDGDSPPSTDAQLACLIYNEDEDGDNDDIYIMMQCLSVCL